MDAHKIISLYGTLKVISTQTGLEPLSDQALATLTLGLILSWQLGEIDRDIREVSAHGGVY